MLYRCVQGQSVAEYGLIAASVGLVSIVALVALGDNLAQLGNNMIPQRGMPAIQTGSDTGSPVLPGGLNADATPATAGMVCGQGWCLDMSEVKQLRRDAVQTQGGLGDNLEAYSNVLDQILQAAHLDSNSETDQVLSRLITETANSGHIIADKVQTEQELAQAAEDFMRRREELETRLTSFPDSMDGQLQELLKWTIREIQRETIASISQERGVTVPQYYDMISMPSSVRLEDEGEAATGELDRIIRQHSNTTCQTGGNVGECVR